ncbi:MAG: biotin transporter BioY [Ruminococcus sp.]|nr:biotin transporter BioY [Ruminococcus sp.]
MTDRINETNNKTGSAFSTLELVYIAVFAALMAVCSWVSIPAPAPLAPFTLQTFAVFATLLLLGGRRGFFSILVFILLGAVGAPVFAGFSGGFGVLLGTTGGYIIGFLFSAVVYILFEHFLGTKAWVKLAALVCGLLVCYAFGTVWFMVVYTRTTAAVGLGSALMWCVVPYLIPDAAKLVLAWTIALAVGKRVRL